MRLRRAKRVKEEPVWAVPPGDKDLLTVAVLGDTGVGKSSLINAALCEDRATVGMGSPVLMGAAGSSYYASDASGFAFWDFEGFHHGSAALPTKTLHRQLTAIERGVPARRIDVAWFCWQASSARLTDGHRRLLAVLQAHDVPVLAVLTKVHATNSGLSGEHVRFASWLQDAGLALASDRVFVTAVRADADLGLVAHGLEPLLEATIAADPGRASHS